MLSQILSVPDKKDSDDEKNEEALINTEVIEGGDQNNKDLKKKEPSKLKTQDFIRIFWALVVVSGIFFWAFLAYIVFNPGQAQFFISLWIRPQDIKTLLEKLVNFSFWCIVLAMSIAWIIILFKAILTKKVFKKKKTISIILSIFIGIILFSSITLWAFLIQKIWATDYINPNWWIIIYDNDKLLSEKFKDNSILPKYNNLIWPLTLRFDFKSDINYYSKFIQIESYEIDFNWDWKIDKSGVNPANEDSIIYNFSTKWTFKPKWVYKWIEIATWKEKEIQMNFPDINIMGIVNVTEKPQRLWWKQVIFDATDVKDIWKINWYLEWNSTNSPDFEWLKFSPKPFTKESLVCMNIYNNLSTSNNCDKIFDIKINDTWDKQDWKITFEQDKINPLMISFTSNISDKDQISTYKWLIDGSDMPSTEQNLEYTFTSYWKHTVLLTTTDFVWNSKDISLDLIIRKPLVLVKPDSSLDPLGVNNSLLRIEDEKWSSLIDKSYKRDLKAYYIKTEVPKKLNFNANYVKVTDNTYELTNVSWDFNWDWTFEKTWKDISFEFDENKKYTITVEYTFDSKLRNSTQKISENIIVEWAKKEFDLNLKVVQDSEYAPTLVHIDWSASQVSDGSISKYTYDFWEWKTPVDWDAKVDYKYNFPWEYTIKLTVTKNNWKTDSTTQKVILKWSSKELVINSSVSSTYIWKSVDFDTIWSNWQIESFSWNFWDWQSSSDPNPTHSYEIAWTFKIKLTVTYSDWSIKSIDKTIEVKENDWSN